MANTGFSKNAHRVDPYKNFKFRVYFEQKIVLGVSKVSMLKRTTQVVTYPQGGLNNTDTKSPGRTTYDPITMERGITFDRDFEDWANFVHPYEGDTSMDLVKYKRNLTLEVMDEKGHPVLRYLLYNCWVSEYTAVPDLDASANAVAIERIQIQIEGWKRDDKLLEPDEASAVSPPS